MIRIIGGSWRGRKLSVLDAPGLRPTPDRIRETLFNWLQSVVIGARCLDLFAGTGILGFEALSRGAAFVTFCEKNRKVALQIKEQADVFKTSDYELSMQDAYQWLSKTQNAPYDIIFCDPPFHQEWSSKLFPFLCENRLVHENTWIYLETEQKEALSLPPGWEIFREQKAGEVFCRLIRRQ